MPEKQKPRDRTNTYTAFIAIAMTMLLALWNGFAGHDRNKADDASTADATLERKVSDLCHMPIPGEGVGTRCITITRTRSS